jgi:hypothetical protein
LVLHGKRTDFPVKRFQGFYNISCYIKVLRNKSLQINSFFFFHFRQNFSVLGSRCGSAVKWK